MDSIRTNLETYAVSVRQDLRKERLAVGLWLPAKAAEELCEEGAAEAFSLWLQERNLQPYTINGFPYDNFHQEIVKHQVYEPAWWTDERRDYTIRLADILARLLPDGRGGSISTLPIGWPSPTADATAIARAGENFRTVASHLRELEDRSGQRIVVAIEPEPGCILDSAKDVTQFFDSQLSEAWHRRYLTVCHDVCHSAVMFEDQADALAAYSAAGVTIGKVQVSNAIEVDWSIMSKGRRAEAFAQLAEFAEDRYLHQTGCRSDDGRFRLIEDLPELIQQESTDLNDDAWRIHFHVPIFLEKFGNLGTTRDQIEYCLQCLQRSDAPEFLGDLEVETYAWTVLPESMRRHGLAKDIASELSWLNQVLTRQGLPSLLGE
ncbi:Xylose isomerase-like TIM barrel [Roseimaritima multifibrata]|uniref:Xylose isomerase-like TIM barrel n=2 Tax=Roseimaritima multifibrata TaxID=1930274 RepID=A0A517MB76_9BACT|nr:Xylose isomerase-like TIM barrel [Roseimaritima multifibrata]